MEQKIIRATRGQLRKGISNLRTGRSYNFIITDEPDAAAVEKGARQKLDFVEKKRLIELIENLESSVVNKYSAVSKDSEFKSDHLPQSKYGHKPEHVGLSFGIIQFSQASGNLGVLIQKMQKKNPELFKKIFGPLSDELVELLGRTGDKKKFDEGLFDEHGNPKPVLRAPAVRKLNGAEIWESPWVDRFIESGKQPVFQDCQIEVAIEYFADPAVHIASAHNVHCQAAYAMILDRKINGMMGLPNYMKDKNANQREFWNGFANEIIYIHGHEYEFVKKRMDDLIKNPAISWTDEYEYEE